MTLISEEYRKQNAELHETVEAYGTSGGKYAEMVDTLASGMGVEEMLDYGCGKQMLANALPQYVVHGYDPAIEGLETPPRPHDLVVCTDVLEHIEPDTLEAVLDDLQRLTRNILFAVVATVPAVKKLPDGRNAHLIVEDAGWWLPKLLTRFDIRNFVCDEDDKAFLIVLRRKGLEAV